MIVITRKKALEKHHILIKTFLDIIPTVDQCRKKELHRRFQSKKLIQKQPFKLAFLMRPKTGTAMANRKKGRSSCCFVFSDSFLASHSWRALSFEYRCIAYEILNGKNASALLQKAVSKGMYNCIIRRSSSFFSMVVHDSDNAEESIGKTTYFNQDFP